MNLLLNALVRGVTRGTRRPFTEGLDVGELVGRERKSRRDCSERATEPRRLAHVRTVWSVPGTQTARTRARRNLVRSLTRVRPSNMPQVPRVLLRDGRRCTPGESLSQRSVQPRGWARLVMSPLGTARDLPSLGGEGG